MREKTAFGSSLVKLNRSSGRYVINVWGVRPPKGQKHEDAVGAQQAESALPRLDQSGSDTERFLLAQAVG